MEIRSLRHFVAVADTLNFNAAARRLHITQPALTRSIATFERRLGLRLFDRDKRHVVLTPEGATLLDRARQILYRADDFTLAAEQLSELAPRDFRVGIYATGLAELTHSVLHEFQRRHPEIKLHVRDGVFVAGSKPLHSGELHAALLVSPTEVPGLQMTTIFTQPIDVVLNVNHPLAQQQSVCVADLLNEPWVTLPTTVPDAWAAHWLAMDKRGPAARPVVAAYAHSVADLCAAVAYQNCVGLAPRAELRLSPYPGVCALPASDMQPVPAGVIHPSVDADPAAPALAAIALEMAQKHPDLVPDAGRP